MRQFDAAQIGDVIAAMDRHALRLHPIVISEAFAPQAGGGAGRFGLGHIFPPPSVAAGVCGIANTSLRTSPRQRLRRTGEGSLFAHRRNRSITAKILCVERTFAASLDPKARGGEADPEGGKSHGRASDLAADSTPAAGGAGAGLPVGQRRFRRSDLRRGAASLWKAAVGAGGGDHCPDLVAGGGGGGGGAGGGKRQHTPR